MRLTPLLLLLATASAANAGPPTGSAQLYAERTALLAGDARCALLARDIRAALIATAAEARYGALRDGWGADALDAVAQRAAQSARARACNDAALTTAARSASAGFRGWAQAQKMDFPGAFRIWSARRAPDAEGWILSQALDGGAAFGVAVNGKGQEQVVLADPGGGATSASLYLRDRARAPHPIFNIPGLETRTGLAAGLAPRPLETVRLASGRVAITPSAQSGRGRTAFIFPAAILAEIAALDPRETIEIEVSDNGAPRRYLVEVGDLAAAQAFLAARVS